MRIVGERIDKVKRVLSSMARQCWEQGLAAQAMLEIEDFNMMLLMARDCVIRQNADGRLCDVEGTPALVDPAICVEPVLAAGKQLNDPNYCRAAEKNIAYLLHKAPRTADGAAFHLAGTQEIWADALGMGPHVLAMVGHVEEAFQLYHSIKARLLDQTTGLYRHKWDEAAQAFIRECYWGVGNGWALVGLMRMALALHSAGDPRHVTVAKDYLALARSVSKYQREDGLFHDVLDDPQSFVETESAEMFAYSLYRMIGAGLADERLLATANKAREAVNGLVDEDGYVHGCAGSPSFDYSGTSAEGQAHYLMMEAAAHALHQKGIRQKAV